MKESELAGKATEVIKRLDKLVRDIRGDTGKLLEALRELKEDVGGKGDGDKEKGE